VAGTGQFLMTVDNAKVCKGLHPRVGQNERSWNWHRIACDFNNDGVRLDRTEDRVF
jgi:hypothetical protein